MPEENFHVSPELFDRVEVRRVRRQKQHRTVRILCQFFQGFLAVERGVVQHNHAARFGFLEQSSAKPRFEQPVVCVALLYKFLFITHHALLINKFWRQWVVADGFDYMADRLPAL